MKQHDPKEQINLKNPWYIADQFKSQLSTYGRRRVIQNRWRIFEKMIRTWMLNHKFSTEKIKLLDAGCGDGINLHGLSQLAQKNTWNVELNGVDYNPIRTQRAILNNPSYRIKEGSLYNLPYADHTFNIILCNHVIEHIPNLEDALKELHRILSPRGLLIVGVPNEGCLLGQLRNRIVQRSILKTTDHIHAFTQKTLKKILFKNNFHIMNIERETFFFPHSYFNQFCNESIVGHTLMDFLRLLFPSQAGGLIVSCCKE